MVRTPDQRLRVFLSSTLGELAPERAAARGAVERLRLTPVMFEPREVEALVETCEALVTSRVALEIPHG